MHVNSLIVGAGVSGLSLALRLHRAGQDVLLVDPRTGHNRDRTFCFWGEAEHEHAHLVSHRWSNWRVSHREHSAVRSSERYTYQQIKADDFYAYCIEVIGADRLALGERVLTVRNDGTRFVVTTNSRAISADQVYDSRPPLLENDGSEPFLLQHFVGWTVRSEAPVFTPDEATLMDFSVDQSKGPHFMYVLPYSETEALVEDTFFTPAPVSPGKIDANAYGYDDSISAYLHNLGAGKYEILHRERGILPMTTQALTNQGPGAPNAQGVVKIGLVGGAARPSTGYAFQAIQRQTNRALHKVPSPPHRRSDLFLDRVFLSYLTDHPEKAPELFVRMFDRCEPDRLIRFLSDTASLRDAIEIMASLPKLPLSLQAARTSGGLDSLAKRLLPEGARA